MSEASSGSSKIKEVDLVKKKKREELDAKYKEINKMLDPIMDELKKIEVHDRHVLVEGIIGAFLKHLCRIERLGILSGLTIQEESDLNEKTLKELVPDMMDAIQEAVKTQKER